MNDSHLKLRKERKVTMFQVKIGHSVASLMWQTNTKQKVTTVSVSVSRSLFIIVNVLGFSSDVFTQRIMEKYVKYVEAFFHCPSCVWWSFLMSSGTAVVFKCFKSLKFQNLSMLKIVQCSKCSKCHCLSCVLMISVKQYCGRVQMEIHSVQMTEIEGRRDTGLMILSWCLDKRNRYKYKYKHKKQT